MMETGKEKQFFITVKYILLHKLGQLISFDDSIDCIISYLKCWFMVNFL